ncbi:MAG TPA: methionyl-tRNA formyltransferase [Candidatus Paceibacterota bacterium]|nr:methionyl-tRNA formyltransferase [Candidatus Paceibacterota bacterium]
MHKPFLYFGTPYVARDTLRYLLEQGYRPEAVITSPDAPKGRGQTLSACETKVFAQTEGLPVLTPERIDDATIAALKEYNTSYAIVVAYGKILPQALIDAFPDGILNIHYSLLPKYRGASPVEGALLNNEPVTGVSIQRMVYELDAGDVLASAEVAIGPDETTRELRPRLVALGSKLLVDTLPSFEAGTAPAVPQDHALATVTKKIKKQDGQLSLSDDGQKNWNIYRAYAESPGTFFFVEKDGASMRVKVRTAQFDMGVFIPELVVPEGKNETAYANLVANGWKPA